MCFVYEAALMIRRGYVDVPVEIAVGVALTGSGGPLIWPFLRFRRCGRTQVPMSELCGNPAAETGEALMPSKISSPLNPDHLTDFSKKNANSTDQEFASNVKLILGTW